MLTGPGPTVIGRFASVEEARRCVIYLRQAGFEEDEVGFNAPAEGPATICGAFVETDDLTGLARRIAPVRVGGRLSPAMPEVVARRAVSV